MGALTDTQRGSESTKLKASTPKKTHSGDVTRRQYVDPAQEAMSRNHNLSPPIHPGREELPAGPLGSLVEASVG